MKRENVFISGVADDVLTVTEKYDLGLEISDFCTAFCMDEFFEESDKNVQRQLACVNLKGEPSKRLIFHGPFNELSPAAIDHKILEVTKSRYLQAIDLAIKYGAKKIVIHSGYSADFYFKEWFHSKSVEFWKSFMDEIPNDIEILYENVFEKAPEQLLAIVKEVDHPRFRLCLDIGHANVKGTDKTVMEWVEVYAPYLSHFHIHNNNGVVDEHAGLEEGNIDMLALLKRASELCPDATFTLETLHSEPSVEWLIKSGLI